eukprot:gene16366-6124_t
MRREGGSDTDALKMRRYRARRAGNTTPGSELRQTGRKRARSASGANANGQTAKRHREGERARYAESTARAGWDSRSVAPTPFKGATLLNC